MRWHERFAAGQFAQHPQAKDRRRIVREFAGEKRIGRPQLLDMFLVDLPGVGLVECLDEMVHGPLANPQVHQQRRNQELIGDAQAAEVVVNHGARKDLHHAFDDLPARAEPGRAAIRAK